MKTRDTRDSRYPTLPPKGDDLLEQASKLLGWLGEFGKDNTNVNVPCLMS